MPSHYNPQGRCPYLGVPDDPHSWFAFPADDNVCHKPRTPHPVAIDYQRRTCLAGKFDTCAVYQEANWHGPLPASLQPEWVRGISPRKRWLIILLATIIPLLIGLALLEAAGNSSRFPQTPPALHGQPPAPTAAEETIIPSGPGSPGTP